MKISFKLLLFSILLAIVHLQCSAPYLRKSYQKEQAELAEIRENQKLQFVKVFTEDGGLYIFEPSALIAKEDRVEGMAYRHYDAERRLVCALCYQSLPLEQVSLVYSQERPKRGLNDALLPLAMANVVVSVFCLTNPKACFGSCPTFYAQGQDHWHQAGAEGFSNAILPSLEYGDIDALVTAPYRGAQYQLGLKNEAQESHCLRKVELWAVALDEASTKEVLHDRQGRFYGASQLHPLRRALHQDGLDLTNLLSAADQTEYSSPADPENLRSREEVLLDFGQAAQGDSMGLVLDFRQSLMTTYFIYSAMAYMGTQVGEILAQAERQGNLYNELDQGLKSELGELEVWLRNGPEADWEKVGSYYETGPIAINRQLMALPALAEGAQIKLRFNRGLWRIDAARLARLNAPLSPVVLQAERLTKAGQDWPEALAELVDSSRHFVTLPGESYHLHYRLPDSTQAYQLFVYSHGYYLEYMRREWENEENLRKLYQMFKQPAAYLKAEAAAYKAYESNMEEVFWSSQVLNENAAR